MTNIIGVHGRNDVDFTERDYQAVREMPSLRWLKMMSHTSDKVFSELLNINPGLQFVTRLYDGDKFGTNTHPAPEDFCRRMIPRIEALSAYCRYFEIHNEPNHVRKIEGWGAGADEAEDFARWLHVVLGILRDAFPRQETQIQFGFPGLAVPDFVHNDLGWLEKCRPEIEKMDFLCAHCYWQTGPNQDMPNHLHRDWGLRFEIYHDLFPNLPIAITEAGNSNPHNNWPLDEQRMARELVDWFGRLAEYDYIMCACPFMLSSPDPTWNPFVWVESDGRFKPVVGAVGGMKAG